MAWPLLHAETEVPDLPDLVDSILGAGGWNLLSSSTPIEFPALSHRSQYGLFQLRHRLVHGWHLPDKDSIESLSGVGIHVVLKLLDPATGISQQTDYDPFQRMRRFSP
jgi:hypothetical protein